MYLLTVLLPIVVSYADEEPKAVPLEEPAAEINNCIPENQFKFAAIELKLNLDGNSKKDAVVRFEGGSGDDVYFRRALVLDADAKPTVEKQIAWLEPCRAGGENPDVMVTSFEKIPAGTYDLLLVREEGAGSLDVRYYLVENGGLKTVLKFAHPSPDGHLTETHSAKSVRVRVTGEDGELEIGGQKIDLDAKSLSARCRVRELYVQLEFEWDRKERVFKEKKQGCVMGAAID